MALHVECCLDERSTADFAQVAEHLKNVLLAGGPLLPNSAIAPPDDFLQQHAEFMYVRGHEDENSPVAVTNENLVVHVYQLSNEPPFADSEGSASDSVALSHQLILPSRSLHGLWDSLIFEPGVKSKLFDYVRTTLLFSDRSIDSNIISWNRVMLLHGPPGTGKTSMCRALAQQLAITSASRYSSHYLVEINSHSLFSKWFSESGKLVQKMFGRLNDMLDDPSAFLFVLIDEVESLTAARRGAISGSEPSDAVRVVNAVLTQLDLIKQRPNVLIMTTSNLTDAIDDAFIDRADIKQYIGLPGRDAVYQILRSCVQELMRGGIIEPQVLLLETNIVKHMLHMANDMTQWSCKLYAIAGKAVGLSGRALRKLPFLAHALFVQVASTSVESYLVALDKAIDHEIAARSMMTVKS